MTQTLINRSAKPRALSLVITSETTLASRGTSSSVNYAFVDSRWCLAMAAHPATQKPNTTAKHAAANAMAALRPLGTLSSGGG